MLSRLIGEDKGGQKEVRERTGRQGIEGGWREDKGQTREVGETTRDRVGMLRRGQGQKREVGERTRDRRGRLERGQGTE